MPAGTRSFYGARWLLVLSAFACDASSGGTWRRYPVFRDFGSFSGIDARRQPYASTEAGALVLDEASASWRRVAMPGARARYFVALDGRELASTYGIYVRASSQAPWSLLEGSRALLIEAVTQDSRQNVYAQTNPQLAAPGTAKSYYVQLAGGSAWTPIALETNAVHDLITDFAGSVYVSTGLAGGARQLRLLDGATIQTIPEPTAETFDFKGERYRVAPAAAQRVDNGMGGVAIVKTPFLVEHVNASGALESWTRFDEGQPNAALRTIFGFGRDDRLYAAIADDVALVPEGAAFGPGDIVSVGRGELTWTVAVPAFSGEADGSNAGPSRLGEYGGGFVADGTMIFGACESGCTGSGNSFSYGIWRLALEGQP